MEHNTQDIWKNLEPLIENCINKAFEKNVPHIISECIRRDEELQLRCKAYTLFRRDSDVDKYCEMLQNFNKMRKKELIIFGISITAINGLIAIVLRKLIS